jgi:catechol 2,3-dioxygenase-like lactoylglutathione lyase family enzyme
MSPAMESMVAVTYVRDIAASRSFYELLGFSEESAGKAEKSAWSALHHGGHTVLLAATRPPLKIPQLPLHFYFWFDDLGAVLARLEAAGVGVTRLGHAPHALGGEAKVVDPDGNTVLLGQRERDARQGEAGEAADEASRFSLLREAAEVVAAGGGAPADCGVGEADGRPCAAPAEVRLADSAGTAVWACLAHAEEILVVVPGSFVAADPDDGIAGFLARRGS